MQYIWKAPSTAVKIGFLVNRYGNVIGQTFIMLEETGYLSQGSEEVCGVSALQRLKPQPHISFVRSSGFTAHSSWSSLQNPFVVSM